MKDISFPFTNFIKTNTREILLRFWAKVCQGDAAAAQSEIYCDFFQNLVTPGERNSLKVSLDFLAQTLSQCQLHVRFKNISSIYCCSNKINVTAFQMKSRFEERSI